MNKSSGTIYGKDKIIDWLVDKTDYLNAQWENLMQAEQAGYNPDGSYRQSNRIQSIAKKARQSIIKHKNELSNLNLSASLDQIKNECNNFLDKWDLFFYYMAKYTKSKNLDDLGAATKSYNAVDSIFSKILSSLGYMSQGLSETPTHSIAVQKPAARSVTEKEIIRMKEVLVKIKYRSCKRLYYEKFAKCPYCGTKN